VIFGRLNQPVALKDEREFQVNMDHSEVQQLLRELRRVQELGLRAREDSAWQRDRLAAEEALSAHGRVSPGPQTQPRGAGCPELLLTEHREFEEDGEATGIPILTQAEAAAWSGGGGPREALVLASLRILRLRLSPVPARLPEVASARGVGLDVVPNPPGERVVKP